jgi:hypothetical protein
VSDVRPEAPARHRGNVDRPHAIRGALVAAPCAGAVEDLAMLVSGLALSVFGTTVVYREMRDEISR